MFSSSSIACLKLLIFGLTLTVQAADRNFTIDYANNSFMKDGQPVQIVSGAIHYFRVHPADWTDRLRKLRYAGFNTVETYIEWVSHEPEPNVYDFTGINNLTAFLTKAQEEDLMVILRPGPFIDAERDMGGLPYWLLRENPDMVLRTMDPTYLSYVDAWFSVLLPMVKPLLYSEGGPVVMVQVENEYGSSPECDFEYTSHLRDLFKEMLGVDALLFSTDGNSASYLKCGKIPDVYATVDFGSGGNVTNSFKAQRLFEPRGPYMNSEFYPGWLDHWGQPHSTVSTENVVATLDEMLSQNASLNVYVFNGGTNFGLTAGSNLGDTFQACPTSYDYDAPLSEAGDLTEKYYAMRDVVGKYLPLPAMTPPTNSSKFAYGNVTLEAVSSLFDVAATQPSVQSNNTLTFEDLSLFNGIVVYETFISQTTTDPAILSFQSVNDRGYVYLDGQLVGLLAREQEAFQLQIFAKEGQKLAVVVESQGRICYGSHINDIKGIIGAVKLGSLTLQDWNNTAVRLTNINQLEDSMLQLSNRLNKVSTNEGELMFYNGTFYVSDDVNHPQDTFLQLDGWNKGIAWVNDVCLGRYWPVMGPQLTLYVPRSLLKRGDNRIMLLELEGAPCGTSAENHCSVTFTTDHVINGPTPVTRGE